METAATLARSALERCARECTTRGWRLAMALLRNQDDAQDAVQQALLAATRKAHRVPHDDPWPWFAAVIAHEAANLRRRRARRAAVSIHSEESPMQPQHPQKGPDHAVEHAELASRLWRELDLLPADEQEALVLTQLGGLTYRQASEQLGVPLGTFNHRISRGLATLRRRLGASDAALLGCVPFLPTFEPPATLHAFVQGKVATLPQTLAAHYVTLGGILVKKSLLVVALAAAVIVMLAVSAAVIGAPHPQPERNGPRSNLPAMAEAEKPTGAAAADNRAVPLATAGNAPATSGTGKPAEPVATATQPEVAPQPERTVREADAAAREAERRAGGENSPEDDAPETVLDSATELDRRVVASLGLATRWVADEPARVIVPGPDGTCLYTAGEHVVARWNADTGERQWAVRVHGDEIQSMALSPDGSRLALATFTKHVPLVDARTGGREGSIAFSSYVFSVGFSPDGALLAGGQMDGVEVRSVADSTQVARLVLPENFPRLDPRDPPAFRQVAFGSDGGSVTGALLPGDSGRITSDFSGCYSDAAAFCRWEMAKPAEPVVFSGKALGVLLGTRAVISGNGQWAFVDAVEPGNYIQSEDEFRAALHYLNLDEKLKAAYADYVKARMAAGATGKPEVFMAAIDLQGGRLIHRVSLGELGRENMPAAFSRDGESLALWDRNTVQVLHTGNWSRRAVSAPYQVGALAFDAAGERIYCNDKDRIVRLRAG
ncbi:MAG: sigma-70 family RNA polymerase sigma factor, partial [Planctomycetes bacterium]|nr:sigma-70 family RNA polymerase sigma factor [Planctomycetota bacterium]